MILEDIEKIITFFSIKSNFLLEEKEQEKEKELIGSFENFHDTLVKLIGNDKNFNSIMSQIFKNEFLIVKNENFKKMLLNKILDNNEYIHNNIKIFKYIIKIDNSPEEISYNKYNILQRNDALIKLLNTCKKDYLEQVIINIFESKILGYFAQIRNYKKLFNYEGNKRNYQIYYKSVINKRPNEALIILDKAFEIFKELIQFLDDYLYNNNKDKDETNTNLYKLYAISYIKIYLSQLSFFLDKKCQDVYNIEKIISTIEGFNKENKFRKVLKIYIFKLFYNLTGKKYDEMINYNFKSKGITFTDLLLDNTNENKYIKEIICEEKPPTEKIYQDFPLLKYFVYTEYKTVFDLLRSEEMCMNCCPLLYKYLIEVQNKNSNVSKLENLYIFNKFNNKMIDIYSFNITREEAKYKILKYEKLYSEPIFSELFEDFIEAWEGVNNQAIQYKDYPKMEKKYLSEQDQLIYFLNDVNEQGYGMYLASAYQNFISWQNEFLQYIIDKGKDKINLSCYIDNMKRRIPIHRVRKNQIISIKGCFLEHPDYSNLEECISFFTKRKIFNKTGKINYSNYNKFEYDVSGIEEELAKVLLPGKCLFKEENDYFVTFWGEGFNGRKSNFLQKFYKKFKQTDLDPDEKNKVLNYLTFRKDNDFRQFFGSMQAFLFYIMSYNFNENDTISNIFNNSYENFIKLNERDKSLLRFFNNENIKDFKGEKILSIFF